MWQRRGHDAWVDAEAATGSLLPILIAPPPLAEVPDLPLLTPEPAVDMPSCVAAHASGDGDGGGAAVAGSGLDAGGGGSAPAA